MAGGPALTEDAPALLRDQPLIDIATWSRFTRQIMAVLLASGFLVGAAVTIVSIVNERAMLQESLGRRSRTLLRALVRAAFVPVILEDKEALETLLDGLMGEADLAYAALYAPNGNVLSQRPPAANLPFPDGLQHAPGGVFEKRMTRKDQSAVLDLLAPIKYQSTEEIIGYARVGLTEDRFHKEILSVARTKIALALAVIGAAFLFGTVLIRRMTHSMRNSIERLQATAELERTNKELEAFSYSVSHDLRAPLRSIDGFSHALLEDYADRFDETGKDYLQRVRAACQRMGQLIDDLLSLSRVIRHELRIESVDLSAIVRSIAAQLSQAEPERRVNVEIADAVEVRGDPGLLRIALENLLSNAWKFTRKTADPRIEFGTMKKDGAQIIFVRDNGAGFDMAYVNKLFGAFQRLHETKDFPGTGIGLATVQRIVHRHGGRVWAEAAVGQGAAFYFVLPWF